MLQNLKGLLVPGNRSKVLNLLILFLIIAAVPLTVFLANQQQDIRQRAMESRDVDLSSVNTGLNQTASVPKGVYAIFVPAIEDGVYSYDKENLEKLLQSPATSGVTLRLRWSNLEPTEGNVNFSIIDDALFMANKYNKTIQLILLPGFFTPKWVISKIPSCEEYLSATALPPAGTVNCGQAKFAVPAVYGGGLPRPYPLPWSETYLSYWKLFLQRVAQKYNNEPGIVSIAVAGPNSVTAEMTLPVADREKWLKLLELFYPAGDPHRNSNLFITEAWQKMIDFYGQAFKGKTLVVTEGNGFISFSENSVLEGKKQIYNYLKNANVGSNAKALQTSRLRSCLSPDNDAFVDVKGYTRDGIIGGIQYHSSAIQDIVTMGCTQSQACVSPNKYCTNNPSSPCCAMTSLDAVKNAVWMYFDNTVLGDKYCNTSGQCGRKGEAKLNYLQVYVPDILDSLNTTGNPGVQEFYTRVNNDITQMSQNWNVINISVITSVPTVLFTPIPTMSGYRIVPTYPPVQTSTCNACSADINNDGIVNYSDYNTILYCLNKNLISNKDQDGRPCSVADINGDGKIDTSDYECWGQNFNKKCGQ